MNNLKLKVRLEESSLWDEVEITDPGGPVEKHHAAEAAEEYVKGFTDDLSEWAGRLGPRVRVKFGQQHWAFDVQVYEEITYEVCAS